MKKIVTILPLVSIVGRPNVGKSTLFNRLIGKRVSIVDDMPGVTRDRIYGRCRIGAKTAYLVDTGGLTSESGKTELEKNIEKQIMMSFEDSSVLVFVADAVAGVTPEDRFIADVLRKYGKPVIMVANKAEGRPAELTAGEFFELGFGQPAAVSALHGDNITAITASIEPLLPETEHDSAREAPVRFCIAGRPNVGKSSIVNAILGEERCVVSEVPGTTRDRVDAEFSIDGRAFVIVDTAGIKRRKTKMERIEFFSTTRSRRAIADSDVTVLVLDATEGLLEGEKRIISDIAEAKRGMVIAVNKMDLVPDPDYDRFVSHLSKKAPFLNKTPLVFVSAVDHSGLDELIDTIVDVQARMKEPLPVELLKNIIYDIRSLYSPGSHGKHVGEIKDVAHDRVNPPRVVIKVNDVESFPPAYVRLIENRIRSVFDLSGVPLELKLSGPKKK
ncbi:MAG TPA: ribosome biogenesis GTPase Der [bacterium]|nr:ribosome biogenesis GTPase Der [bacterium]